MILTTKITIKTFLKYQDNVLIANNDFQLAKTKTPGNNKIFTCGFNCFRLLFENALFFYFLYLILYTSSTKNVKSTYFDLILVSNHEVACLILLFLIYCSHIKIKCNYKTT